MIGSSSAVACHLAIITVYFPLFLSFQHKLEEIRSGEQGSII